MHGVLRVCAAFLLALSVTGATLDHAGAATAVGKVNRLVGSADGTTEGKTQVLAEGVAIHMDDLISTGVAARLEVGFDDGSMLRVGENAQIKVDRFVYQPQGSTNVLQLTVVGPFRFISGKLTKIAGSDASVTTATATIGVRGTDFWGGPIDGAFGVFLIEGAVSVTNNAGTVSMDTTGQGTNLVGPDQAPGAVTIWPEEKAARALATVANP
jgi:hypothetical protein